jgi:DNA repair exonuclease SbcCD nuclease subunit
MTSVKFLHTADWQLGMGRHFLGEEASARFKQARIDVIRTMAELAGKTECSFAVVCGDVWESNHVHRRQLGRALEALGAMPCPVYLLPGNHDPLDAGTIYGAPDFARDKPDNVHVLETNEPVQVVAGVELVGVPWRTKHPTKDLVAQACAQLEPRSTTLRVCAAHGAVEGLVPGDDPGLISRANMEAALEDGRIHYFALGDRHSVTKVGERIWYSGAPEPTDYGEQDSGNALVVTLSSEDCGVMRHPTGRWRFVLQDFGFTSEDDVDAAERLLDEMPDKEVTILKLTLKGELNLKAKARLDGILDAKRELFGALSIWERHTDLAVLPDDLEAAELNVAGFARETLDALQDEAKGEGDDASTARDALGLLYRLVMGVQP